MLKLSRPLRHILPLAIVFVVLLILMPRAAKWGYDYRQGSPWKYETLIARFDFPILKTQDQLADEKSNSSTEEIPYYRYSDEVVNRSIRSVQELQLGRHQNMTPALVSALRSVYSKGVVSDDGVKIPRGTSSQNAVIYIQKDKRASKRPASEVYKLSEAREKVLADVLSAYPRVSVDSLLREKNVYNLVVPNLIYDQQTTALVHAESDNNISPTSGYVAAGQLIVSEDEIVTAEIAQILDSYKSEYESNLGATGHTFSFWMGNVILAIAILAILYFAVYFTNRKILDDISRYSYLLLVFTTFAVITLVVQRINSRLLFVMPFTLSGLYLQAFFKNKVIVPFYLVSLLPLLIYTDSGIVMYVMFALAGVVAIFVFQRFNKGWLQFVTAFITFVALSLVFLGFKWIGLISGSVPRMLMNLLVGSILTVAGYPLIYLFERMFNLVSISRLQELCDTGNPVLHQLEEKAPGTFQHSLQVMNMCDAAASAIGANRYLVRAGALYHDIGKMMNPLCFVENESLITTDHGAKYHSEIPPLQSAQDIIRHVSDGVALAQRNRLPNAVMEFILTHHGTNSVSFFYDRYLRQGGDPADRDKFCYQGQKPVSAEQVILMIADSVEAASRTLPDYSAETVSALVEKIVAQKIDEGQLENAELTLSQLVTIKEIFKAHVAQTHHARVKYPEKQKQQ